MKSETVQAAFIAAVSGLLGALLGGGITYMQSKQALDAQFRIEERRQLWAREEAREERERSEVLSELSELHLVGTRVSELAACSWASSTEFHLDTREEVFHSIARDRYDSDMIWLKENAYAFHRLGLHDLYRETIRGYPTIAVLNSYKFTKPEREALREMGIDDPTVGFCTAEDLSKVLVALGDFRRGVIKAIDERSETLQVR